MSESGGLWKHENNQHALVPPTMECGCPSGGGIKNGHILYGGTHNFFFFLNHSPLALADAAAKHESYPTDSYHLLWFAILKGFFAHFSPRNRARFSLLTLTPRFVYQQLRTFSIFTSRVGSRLFWRR